MPPGSAIVDVTYDDPQTGQRVRERRIQEIPDDEIDYVRRREMGMVLAPRRDQDAYYDRDDDYYMNARARGSNNQLAVDNYTPRRARSNRGGNSRRRSPSSSSGDSNDEEQDRRRRRRGADRRARSARPAERDAESDDEGILWYSGKARKDGNLFERTFDSSYDGLIAAAAGAALGAMTARRFAHKEGEQDSHKNWKTVGGALAGAAAFNAVENRYRVYTEEREERKERKEEREEAERR